MSNNATHDSKTETKLFNRAKRGPIAPNQPFFESSLQNRLKIGIQIFAFFTKFLFIFLSNLTHFLIQNPPIFVKSKISLQVGKTDPLLLQLT
jgi:hypothetical protein